MNYTDDHVFKYNTLQSYETCKYCKISKLYFYYENCYPKCLSSIEKLIKDIIE